MESLGLRERLNPRRLTSTQRRSLIDELSKGDYNLSFTPSTRSFRQGEEKRL